MAEIFTNAWGIHLCLLFQNYQFFLVSRGGGSYISRGTFESNPRAYFSGLHGGSNPNK
ncbi:hypothetical protein DEO72_LG9g3577 [Vigna unguiculata]|uniref:Uncharacterized protein n=1 Tax=Vigna unguiculata TaxID=3917 RepID=A0A4D6N5H0_VIGUN|nr:hypothetical protein DEO72_LG9g3577 [Vigna unguiculata]